MEPRNDVTALHGPPPTGPATTPGRYAGTVVEARRRRCRRPTAPSGTRSSPAAATTAFVVPREGARVRLTDLHGDACAGLLLHRADQTWRAAQRGRHRQGRRWQAYLGPGQLLPSATWGGCWRRSSRTPRAGTTPSAAPQPPRNEAPLRRRRRRRAAPTAATTSASLLAKLGLGRRDIAPNVNLFKGVRVEADGSLTFAGDRRSPAAHVELRAELPLLVSIVNVPHPHRPRRPTWPTR